MLRVDKVWNMDYTGYGIICFVHYCMYVRTSVGLSVCWSVGLSVCLPAYLRACLSHGMQVSMSASVQTCMC